MGEPVYRQPGIAATVGSDQVGDRVSKFLRLFADRSPAVK